MKTSPMVVGTVADEGRRAGDLSRHRTQRQLRIFFAFFITSGFCGLIYEVVWLRLAMASFGVTTALTSIVIAMFMAGLGLGSWGAGRLVSSGRWAGAIDCLKLYALTELGIGASAICVPLELQFGRFLLQSLKGFAIWQSSKYYFLVGLLLAIALIPWCACMGATFPLLMAAIRKRQVDGAERSFSYLYLANVVGALFGTATSVFIFIEMLGFSRTLWLAGVCNVLLALTAFRMATRSAVVPQRGIAEFSVSGTGNLYGLPRLFTLSILFTTGFVSLGLEVVWIRQFTPYLGNVVYAFAGILIIYLGATLVGSQDYRRWVFSHAPGESAGSWPLLGLFVVIPLLTADPLLPLRVGNVELGGVRVSFIVLFCALCGFLTPLLVDTFSSGDPRGAGTAYAVNIAGSICGPLVAGFCLLPWVGERKTVALLSLPIFGIAALITFFSDKSGAGMKIKFVACAVGAFLLFRFSHDYENKYSIREVIRDYAATVIATGKGFDRQLLVNGVGMTKLTPETKYMAHLPMSFLQHRPSNGLIICFGMGTSFRSMLSWGIPVTAVELVPSVPELFPFYHADAPKVLDNPIAKIVIDDGRRFLDGSAEPYDVIVVDPPPPTAAPGSSLLYSSDFYEVVKKHLRKGGILQVWYPAATGDDATAAAVAKSLQRSFTYVRPFLSYNRFGIHFLASMEEFADESSSTLAARMPDAALKDFLEWGPASTPQDQFEKVLASKLTMAEILAADPKVPPISDDQPINEYYLLRSWMRSYR